MSIVILAGGASRRMGEDKALLRPVPGGPTMIERVARRAEAFSEDRIVVAPPDRGYGDLLPGWRVVPDAFPGAGPAGGLLTALQAARSTHVLMLPCDAPLIAGPLIRYLLERADLDHPVIPWRMGVSRQGRGRTLEVLHGVYPVTLAPQIEKMFAAGERQLFRIVRELDPILIGPDQLTRYDPGLFSFRTLNSPEDLAGIDPELFGR